MEDELAELKVKLAKCEADLSKETQKRLRAEIRLEVYRDIIDQLIGVIRK